MIKSQLIDYNDDNTILRGYYAYEEMGASKKPAVLVCHDWSGRNEFACEKANQLATLGYVGFALDMYGNGQVGTTKEEKSALMQPLMQNRALLAQRIASSVKAVTSLDMVDASRMAAIGFCFGGLCVLDLARSGANIKGAVSFHGLLQAPTSKIAPNSIKAKLLILHGYDDPMVPPQQVLDFATEMNQANVNWQINMYSQTMHAFMNPEANDPNFGTVYNKQTEHRAWVAMQSFLHDIFENSSFK